MQVDFLTLDHPNEIGALTPWQVDFRQLDPGHMTTRIAVSAGQSVTALNIAMSQRVHQRGASPHGWTTFGIPTPNAIDTWKGKALTRDALLEFGDCDGFDGVSTSAFAGNVVSFDSKRLSALARACGFELPDQTARARGVASSLGLDSLRKLNLCLAAQFSTSKVAWTAMLEESMMLEMLKILTDGSAHFDKSQAPTRRRSLNRAIELMQTRLEDPILIEDLCRQCGASWRTLDRAFKESFGVSPKSYYLRLRLNRVREGLLNAPQCAVTDIANRHGFWHLGQFARDYRLFFGELPSQTRQRAQVRARR